MFIHYFSELAPVTVLLQPAASVINEPATSVAIIRSGSAKLKSYCGDQKFNNLV